MIFFKVSIFSSGSSMSFGGGGVGVELLKWDFGSRLVPSGTALRNGKHGRSEVRKQDDF